MVSVGFYIMGLFHLSRSMVPAIVQHILQTWIWMISDTDFKQMFSLLNKMYHSFVTTFEAHKNFRAPE